MYAADIEACLFIDKDSIAMAGNYIKDNQLKKNKDNTVKYFILFKQEALYWINIFGLKGWDIIFTNKYDTENRATIGWKVTGRIAKINLSRNWEEGTTAVTPENIKKAAFHEVCELFFSRLQMMAEGRLCNNKDCIEEEVHSIIRTLENTVFIKNERASNV